MKSISFNKKTMWVEIVEPIIIVVVLILWVCSMVLQFQRSIVNYEFTIFLHHGEITLTLFGFTLLGGIFEKIKKEDQEYKKVLLRLFDVSLNFLLAAICFFFLYSLMFWVSQNPEPILTSLIVFSIVGAIVIGAGNTIFGMIRLYKILRSYRSQFDK